MYQPAPARRPGRPSRLSREAVVDAADALVEREGIEALTMRGLAEELESSPMAVYRHVRDKDELLMLLLDRRAAGVPRPALPEEPEERLKLLFGILFDGLSESPWIVEVLAKGDLVAPSILWAIDEILASFLAAGLTPEQAASSYHVAWRYTVGELTVRHASERHLATLRREPRIGSTLAGVDPAEIPHLLALESEMAVARGALPFGDGLAAVIDGLLRDSSAGL